MPYRLPFREWYTGYLSGRRATTPPIISINKSFASYTSFLISNLYKDSESREQSQACLRYAEVHPILFKDNKSREQSQACLRYAEAHPILFKDNKSREQSQACLRYAEAHPILFKDNKSREQSQACLNYSVKRGQNESTRFAERGNSLIYELCRGASYLIQRYVNCAYKRSF